MTKFGIAELSIIPIRAAASHKSEMVSQLLFGETYQVLQNQKDWILIRCTLDEYEGWISENQYANYSEKNKLQIQDSNTGIAIELISPATSSKCSIPLVIGSSLPFYDGMNFKLGKEKFIYNGQALHFEQARTSNMLEKLVLKFLHTPYLWGGRSPFGIDCSGFTQIIFKCMGIVLKRDAWQQAEMGKTVDFIQESMLGDLAFFHNEEGRIIHVGIILKEQKIIHASGQVRIDSLDHFGIFNDETKKYSHQLKVIKRFF